MNTGDFNRLTWIGGCLPLLAVCVFSTWTSCHNKLIMFISGLLHF
jgi:hypothetical protein